MSFAKRLKEWLKAFGIALLVLLFVRGFLFEFYTIPSNSMEGSLLPGDFICVSKLSYGPRLIQTPLSIPFVQQKWFSAYIQLPYYRFFSSPQPHRNDILVFNHPFEKEFPVDHRTVFVKRCIGLPGEAIRISKDSVFINGKVLPSLETEKYNYTIRTAPPGLSKDFRDKTNLHEGGPISDKGDYVYSLTKEQLLSVRLNSKVKEIVLNEDKAGLRDETLFPFSASYVWNIDHFGPLYIPKKGDTLLLDTITIQLYKHLIVDYEKNELLVSGSKIMINNKVCKQYICKMNYFFVMGDNRHNSVDSRYWGLLPEDHIIGKAKYVLFNNKTKKDRTFITIH